MRERDERTKEREYEAAKAAFRNHVVSAELNREGIVKGWELFLLVANRQLRQIESLMESDIYTQHVVDVLSGKGELDETKTSLAHFTLETLTYNPINSTVTGELLQGLPENDLGRAAEFCVKMNEVGREPGDLDIKYPIVAPQA